MEFQIGDWVYAEDWCYGQIVEISGDEVAVEFDTTFGGGTCFFNVNDLVHAKED